MSANNYAPHVFVLPEDQANRDIVLGFLTYHRLKARVIIPLQNAGGRGKVVETFKAVEISRMRKYPQRFMILLIDLDNNLARLAQVQSEIPPDLTDRVFVLGSLRDPEALRSTGLGRFEDIGLALAKDCDQNTNTIWGHALLQHNANELARLQHNVRPILFP
jgi:hypothetical protein